VSYFFFRSNLATFGERIDSTHEVGFDGTPTFPPNPDLPILRTRANWPVSAEAFI